MPVMAGPGVALYSDDSATSRQLHQLLSAELRQAGFAEVTTGVSRASSRSPSRETGAAAGSPANSGEIAVAIGASSLRQIFAQANSRQIVVVLITRRALEEELAQIPARAGRDIHAIVLDQPLGRYLDLVRLALPQKQRVGILLGPATASQQKTLEKLAGERNLTLSVARVYEDVVFIPQLERVLSQSDILLALPDASVHNRTTVQPLLLTTYRAGVPVVGYSEAYAQAGALLALYSTPAQLSRQALEVVQVLSLGRGAPPIQAPRYFSVSVNGSVARSLGLTLPPAEVLRERLLQSSSSSDLP